MKKILIAVFLFSIAIAVYSQTGTIRELSGEVELKHSGSSVFVRAENGSQVAQNTVISTGFRSTAVIAEGNSLITVQPLTRLTLAEIQSSAGIENLNVNLQAGRIRVEVNPPAGTRVNTTVQSPSATASVRGTVLEMDINNLDVIQGTVDWKGSDNVSVSVTNGSSSISISGGAQNPITMSLSDFMPSPPTGTDFSDVVITASKTGESMGNLDIIIDFQ